MGNINQAKIMFEQISHPDGVAYTAMSLFYF